MHEKLEEKINCWDNRELVMIPKKMKILKVRVDTYRGFMEVRHVSS